MDWLTRLPVIGPAAARVLRSRPYRVYQRFSDTAGNRLAGAVTFYGFLALFPLLTVAASLAAALLGPEEVDRLQRKLAAQVPGIASSLDLDSLVRNAGTVGVISGVVLLVSGLGWVATMRSSVRLVWGLPEEPGNPFVRKLLDTGVLIGLGAVSLVSMAASSVGSALAGRLAELLGVSRTVAGGPLLAVAGFIVAVGSDTLLFGYLLVGLPRLRDELRGARRRRTVVQGALLGAFGFEVLKVALASYLSGVAARSMYGAFGVPVALLLWINFVSRLLFYCAAWTALPAVEERAARRR